MRIKCCIDCPDRSAECHAECEKYIKEKAEYNEQQALIGARKKADNNLRGFKIEALSRMLKTKGGQR